MSNTSLYFSKPKRKSGGGGFMWLLILILVGLMGWGGYYIYKENEKQAAEKLLKEKEEIVARQKAEKEAKQKKEEEAAAKLKAEELAKQQEEEAKKQKEAEEARRKADEQAKQLEAEARKQKEDEEARLKAEEEDRLRREKEWDEKYKAIQDEEKARLDKLPKPFAFKVPNLKDYTPESKDSIPMDKDQVLDTWTWEKARKYDEIKDNFPTQARKWTDRAQAVKMAETYKKWREEDPSRIKASPSAKDFPGVPEDGAELVTRTVLIDSSIGGWHSTGLYAPPGSEISFSFSGAYKETVSVRIGCHTDSLIHDKVDSWSRLPIMGNSTSVKKSKVSLADPSGGLVYVCVDNVTKGPKIIKVKISGATPAPLYIMGETTPEQWQKQLETTKAPWGEIRTPRVVYTMSTELLKKCEKIKEVSEVLQKGMALQDWIAGWDEFPNRIRTPMRFVVDRQISIGYGHSGYPAMGSMDWANSLVTGNILTGGDWGLWHELGHNHQGNPVAMEGQTEVSVNIFSMLCQVWAVGEDPLYGRGISPIKISEEMEKYLSDKSVTYIDAPNEVQLFLWGELMFHFGPEPFREVHKMYHKKPYKNDKMTDADKWNWIMRAFGQVLKKDLSLYFETWKLPIDTFTKSQLKKNPEWKPNKKYPSPTYLREE